MLGLDLLAAALRQHPELAAPWGSVMVMLTAR